MLLMKVKRCFRQFGLGRLKVARILEASFFDLLFNYTS
jgi:hypothetical protein